MSLLEMQIEGEDVEREEDEEAGDGVGCEGGSPTLADVTAEKQI